MLNTPLSKFAGVLFVLMCLSGIVMIVLFGMAFAHRSEYEREATIGLLTFGITAMLFVSVGIVCCAEETAMQYESGVVPYTSWDECVAIFYGSFSIVLTALTIGFVASDYSGIGDPHTNHLTLFYVASASIAYMALVTACVYPFNRRIRVAESKIAEANHDEYVRIKS